MTVGNTVSFLGRNITNRGDYYELGLADSYNTTLLEEAKMENCKPATAPGTAALKTPTARHQQQTMINHCVKTNTKHSDEQSANYSG